VTISYLNGKFIPLDQARISPLDRGFLFGDGIYEFIAYYGGRPVGFNQHIERLFSGLQSIGIESPLSKDDWRIYCDRLLQENDTSTSGVYIQVSRGADTKRSHSFPEGVAPTVFIMLVDMPSGEDLRKQRDKGLRIISEQDRRWRNCDIKSTALLGNILHFQHAVGGGYDETLLFNADGELTEGAASNVFVVIDGEVVTPQLDGQKLPGINRQIILDVLRAKSDIPVREAVVTLEEARSAHEIWFSNSAVGIIPVVELDGKSVSQGRPGPIFQQVEILFEAAKLAE
jgi:D-alanine transaminase